MSEHPRAAVSVVVPVYGCRECLGVLVDELTTVLSQSSGTFEIILVDDGSPWRRRTVPFVGFDFRGTSASMLRSWRDFVLREVT